MNKVLISALLIFLASFIITSCQIGATTYAIGGTGTVTTAQSITIIDINAGRVSMPLSSTPLQFSLPNRLTQGSRYNVTALNALGNSCNVQNGSGVVDNADINNIVISC